VIDAGDEWQDGAIPWVTPSVGIAMRLSTIELTRERRIERTVPLPQRIAGGALADADVAEPATAITADMAMIRILHIVVRPHRRQRLSDLARLHFSRR
jgi:hypothetical protein